MVLRPEQRTDDELLTSGDPADFEVFYRRHAEWVLGYLSRRTRDADLAADLCAEVFAAALLSRPRYRARDGQANSWLFRIAANKLADAQRRGYAEDRARRRLGMERLPLDDGDREDIDALGETEHVLEIVEELDDDQATVIRARYVDERSYGEIAGELGVSEAVVRKRVSRGLQRLRSRMGRPT